MAPRTGAGTTAAFKQAALHVNPVKPPALDVTSIDSPPADRADPSSCDLCGSTEVRVLFEAGERRYGMPGRFAVVRCLGCRLVRTDPAPSAPSAYYPRGDYYSFAAPAAPTKGTRDRIRAMYAPGAVGPLRARLERVLASRFSPGLPPAPPGAILDVGCGSGAFLLGLRDAGWDCHGIEIDPTAVAAASRAGLDNVRQGDLTAAGHAPRSFDVVRFWHSLEHVKSPRAQLIEARRVLRPGGRLVIGVPNFASALSRAAGSRWFYLDLPRHLSHFEPPTLRRLVSECGFDVTRLSIASSGVALLGTLDYVRGRGERLLASRAAWYGALPVAIALDLVKLGDALWLEARPTP